MASTEAQTQVLPQLGHGGEPVVREQLYIGGEWVDPVGGGGVLEVIDSTTEEVMGRVPEGTAGDVDRAVAAARSAFEIWSQTSIAEREEACRAVAPALAARGAVVAKPSEVTPLNAFILAEVIDEVGLPGGVFNLVPGYGPKV